MPPDSQFHTAITNFPVLRNQEKYQFRYDLIHSSGRHAPRLGVSFIHEPALSGALSGTAETLFTFPQDPIFYLAKPSQFVQDYHAGSITTSASNGSFSQNIQRLGIYAEDSWRLTSHLTLNYGLRYDTTFGLFSASGRTQLENPAYRSLRALQVQLINGAPHDYRKAFGPRLGLAYSPGKSGNTVFRAGLGLFYNDLAQSGWVTALQEVNTDPAVCARPGDSGCIPGAANGGTGTTIDPHYKTPYALHATAGFQHALNPRWTVSADYTHEEGNHAYRAYNYTSGFTLFSPDPNNQKFVPDMAVFKSDNRSSYNALMLGVQGKISPKFNLVAHYTLSHAQTWGCVLGELFDYVNGVCDPLNPFAKGDYGPAGEDVTHRFVLAGTFPYSGWVRPYNVNSGGKWTPHDTHYAGRCEWLRRSR